MNQCLTFRRRNFLVKLRFKLGRNLGLKTMLIDIVLTANFHPNQSSRLVKERDNQTELAFKLYLCRYYISGLVRELIYQNNTIYTYNNHK